MPDPPRHARPDRASPVIPDSFAVIPGLTRNPSAGKDLISAPTPSPQETGLTAAEPTSCGEGPPPKM